MALLGSETDIPVKRDKITPNLCKRRFSTSESESEDVAVLEDLIESAEELDSTSMDVSDVAPPVAFNVGRKVPQ